MQGDLCQWQEGAFGLRVGGNRLFVGVLRRTALATALHAVAFGDAGGGLNSALRPRILPKQCLHFAVAVKFAEEGGVVGVTEQVFGVAVDEFLEIWLPEAMSRFSS